MKYRFTRLFLILLTCQTPSINIHAQDSARKKEMDELRLKLNDDGTHYVKLVLLGQLWFRFNQNNPSSTVLKQPANETFDIGIRRLRFQLFGQLTDHAFFYLHFGQDNFNFLSQRKFTSFIQDVLAEFKVKKGSEDLILGGGLTIANGLSRFTQPQLVNILSTDIPVFTLPTFDLTDQAGRKLSFFARGQIGHLDYRAILSDPFPVTTSSPAPPVGNPTSANASFAQQGHSLQYSGLFIWNFFEREPHVILFMPGTYYGKKKVLNLEAGFIYQKNATWSSPDSGRTINYHPLNCWSVAVFYDAPLNKQKGTALNAYIGYFNYDYGHGYLRYIGVMNPADGLASAKYPAGSQGNAFPMFGTGNIMYAQFGYLCKKNLLGNQLGTLMPYATAQAAKYDRLDKKMLLYNLGINWFLKSNTSKISFDYQNRPVYYLQGNDLFRASPRKGQFVMQYQFFF
ncbi:MAG TPA: hypothetical protein VMT76_08740 [Puia sp.]|nr:hypothetical protein [Puia sp.]